MEAREQSLVECRTADLELQSSIQSFIDIARAFRDTILYTRKEFTILILVKFILKKNKLVSFSHLKIDTYKFLSEMI